MKPIIRKIYLLLIILCSAGTAFAQPAELPGHITGTLFDDQGKPMMFASATLLNAKDSTIVQGSVTNEDGIYIFEHIKEGSYLVKASFAGYQTIVSQPFNIEPS